MHFLRASLVLPIFFVLVSGKPSVGLFSSEKEKEEESSPEASYLVVKVSHFVGKNALPRMTKLGKTAEILKIYCSLCVIYFPELSRMFAFPVNLSFFSLKGKNRFTGVRCVYSRTFVLRKKSILFHFSRGDYFPFPKCFLFSRFFVVYKGKRIPLLRNFKGGGFSLDPAAWNERRGRNSY